MMMRHHPRLAVSKRSQGTAKLQPSITVCPTAEIAQSREQRHWVAIQVVAHTSVRCVQDVAAVACKVSCSAHFKHARHCAATAMCLVD
jgi:hypothetical protein